MKRYRPGDVVAMLFGVQSMTVESDDGLLVRCVWVVEGQLRRSPFLHVNLRRALRRAS